MIKKNENLTDEIQMPLIRLFYSFQDALQAEDYELCVSIKNEMDRREGLYRINKRALRKILDCFRVLPPNDVSRENIEYSYNVFEKYL